MAGDDFCLIQVYICTKLHSYADKDGSSSVLRVKVAFFVLIIVSRGLLRLLKSASGVIFPAKNGLES